MVGYYGKSESPSRTEKSWRGIVGLARPELWYRIGSAQEQRALEAYKGAYTGLVVPAHILAWGRAWVTGLLSRVSKPFLVDPMTFIFAQGSDMIKGVKEVKKSYEKLLGLYGDSFWRIVERRPVRPTDFLDTKGN